MTLAVWTHLHQVLQSSTVHPQESQYQYPSAPYLKLERDALSSSRPSDMLAHLGRLSGGFKAACHGKNCDPCSMALWLHAAPVPGPQAMLLGYRPCGIQCQDLFPTGVACPTIPTYSNIPSASVLKRPAEWLELACWGYRTLGSRRLSWFVLEFTKMQADASGLFCASGGKGAITCPGRGPSLTVSFWQEQANAIPHNTMPVVPAVNEAGDASSRSKLALFDILWHY